MIPILDYEVNDFGDAACFVEGSIHIIDRDGLGRCWCFFVFFFD